MTLTADTFAALRAIGLEPRTDSEAFERFGRDWSRLHSASPGAIVFPRRLEDVLALVELANTRHLALVPSGGRTGLSGGATACRGEIVVSFDKMNAIREFDTLSGTAVCEAGVITEQLQQFAIEHGWYYPVDFGSRGSSQLGGNIATNAGGIKVIRYGMTRNWVTGLTVVTGKGELLTLNHGLIKNATGYDLRHLFIGSEGTLGLIVSATVQFTRQPDQPRVLLLAVPTLAGIMACYGAFARQISLNAFECFTDRCLEKVLAHGASAPFDEPSAYYALLEFDAPSDRQFDEALAIFTDCMAQGWVSDGIASESDAQRQSLWRLREGITEAIADRLPYKNDVSVPVAKVESFLQELDELLRREYPSFEVLYFGHIGDGNLHINILKPHALEHAQFIERCEHANALVFETVSRYSGSISAEHGVGLTKKPYLHYTRSAEEIALMKGIKALFDPNGIMNPGKIF